MAGPIKSNKPSGEFLQLVESANPTLTGLANLARESIFSDERWSYTYQGTSINLHPNSRFFWSPLGLHDLQPRG